MKRRKRHLAKRGRKVLLKTLLKLNARDYWTMLYWLTIWQLHY